MWHTTLKEVKFFRDLMGLNRCVGMRVCGMDGPGHGMARGMDRVSVG